MDEPLTDVARSWTELGDTDPMWAALTNSGKGNTWNVADFLDSGREEIGAVSDLVRRLGLRPPKGTALDFGCGPGRLTAALGASGFEKVLGVDLSPTMLDRARQILPPALADVCEFRLNTESTLCTVATGSVDFVYCCRVLQHMPTVLAHGYIREFLRIVSPSGVVVFQIPAGPAPGVVGAAMRAVPDAVLTKLRRGMQMHATEPDEVVRLIADSGGACVSIEQDSSAGPRWRSHLYVATPRNSG